MRFSRRALLKASAASAVLGGIGAPLVARARTHFAKSDEIMARNPRRIVRAPRIMSRYYSSILKLLTARGFALPRTPVRVSKITKLAIVLRYAFV